MRTRTESYVCTRRMIYWAQYVSAHWSKYRLSWPLTQHKPATWPDPQPLEIMSRLHSSRCNDSISDGAFTLVVDAVYTRHWTTIAAVDRRSMCMSGDWRWVQEYELLRQVETSAVDCSAWLTPYWRPSSQCTQTHSVASNQQKHKLATSKKITQHPHTHTHTHTHNLSLNTTEQALNFITCNNCSWTIAITHNITQHGAEQFR